MKKKRLGKSDIYISMMGMGCWSFGGGKYWGSQSQKDVDAVVHRALDMGINYFDTAEVYNDGESEKSLGSALKGRRELAIIGTKVSPSNTAPQILRAHCEESLRRLDTDYIDIYMLHWPITSHSIHHFTSQTELLESPPSVQEAFNTLSQLKEEGKIREIGISNFGVKQMSQAEAAGADIAVNELAYNLISRGIEETILPYCVEKQIGTIGYMALQQGVLAGRYRTPDEIPPMQAHSRHFHYSRGGEASRHGEEGAEAEVFHVVHELERISRELNIHMSQLSLAWAMANQDITCTLVGSRNVKQLEENAGAAAYSLDKDVRIYLDGISLPVLKKLGSNPDYYENRSLSRIE